MTSCIDFINSNISEQINSIHSFSNEGEAVKSVVTCLHKSYIHYGAEFSSNKISVINLVINAIFPKFGIPGMNIQEEECEKWHQVVGQTDQLSILVAEKVKSSVYNRFNEKCELIAMKGDRGEYRQPDQKNLIVDWRDLNRQINQWRINSLN